MLEFGKWDKNWYDGWSRIVPGEISYRLIEDPLPASHWLIASSVYKFLFSPQLF